ncbi:nitroreductase [Nitratireductor aquibiodomus RA22]|uniref:Nitroreductase n=2 Tax=Nitratireductor aquibiodomus TaxID=204799 RepID=I5C750_9HYPH|nr:nitroreductase [Nitratireductor aquibiodomus RA22]
MRRRAQAFYDEIRTRHTVRDFSSRPVPRDIIETCIRLQARHPTAQIISLAFRRHWRPCREKADPRSSRGRGEGVL